MWQTVELGSLANFKNGLNFGKESWGRGLKIIGVSDFKDRLRPEYSELEEINPKGVARDVDLLHENDIVFVRSNGNRQLIGRSLLVRNLLEPVSHSGFTIRLRFESHQAFPLFYAYLFRSDLVRQVLSGTGGGTNINNLNQGLLSRLRVPVPPQSVQRRIAAILSAYDDLIENNRRRIALLEKMAEEIYREWFVRLRFPGHEQAKVEKGVPVGWSRKKLPELATITYGFPFDAQRFNSIGLGRPIIRIRNIANSATQDFTDEVADEKYIVRKGDLLIGMDGEFHINHWQGDDAYLVQRSCRIKPKHAGISGYLALALRAPIKHFESTIVGATVGHLGAKHLNSIEILVPPAPIAQHLQVFNDLLAQKIALSSATNKLASTRDALLPRLISGKLPVDALDIHFPSSMQLE